MTLLFTEHPDGLCIWKSIAPTYLEMLVFSSCILVLHMPSSIFLLIFLCFPVLLISGVSYLLKKKIGNIVNGKMSLKFSTSTLFNIYYYLFHYNREDHFLGLT